MSDFSSVIVNARITFLLICSGCWPWLFMQCVLVNHSDMLELMTCRLVSSNKSRLKCGSDDNIFKWTFQSARKVGWCAFAVRRGKCPVVIC